ncbi:MAG: FtsX-like permease family protein [Bacteroidota bacterium]
MNTELFIAKRIFRGKGSDNRFSKPIINIAVVGIALGIVVMIIALAVVSGFKKEIRNKVIGFGSHIQITNYDANYSFESIPIDKNQDFYPKLSEIEGINHVQIFATKAGIIKTDNEIQGVVFKGVGPDFDWSFFSDNLFEGKCFSVNDTLKTNDVLISKSIASMLNLTVGDDFIAYFIQDPPRTRKFSVSGIYKTGLVEFDDIFVITDIGHVQKLNDWTKNQISGFEVLIDNYNEIDEMTEIVRRQAGFRFYEDGSKLKIQSIIEKYPHFFDWMRLFDTNVWVILILMTTVAGFNMVSGLLIIILERTRMIGILKAIGAENFSIRKIFLYNAVFLIAKGMIWGNTIGIIICLLQKYTEVLKLDSASYYVDTVPVNINIIHLLLLNVGTLIATFAMMIIPSMIISRISPIKAIKFN